MKNMPAKFIPVNFTLDPQIYYLLYVGELKNLGLTAFLESFLSRRLNRQVRTIAVVPDQLEQYNYTNLLVYMPAGAAPAEQHRSCRCDTSEFLRAVSQAPAVENLVRQLLAHQHELYLYMYESKPEITLDRLDGVILLGPDKELAARFNDKAVQFRQLQGLVPLVEHRFCDSFEELLAVTGELRPSWRDGIFVSRVYSAAGAASLVSHNQEQIREKFNRDDSPFLISRYMKHHHDPTVLAVTANSEDVYIAGVADQRIEGGNRFVGSTWPSTLDKQTVEELAEHTRTVGRFLGRHGYRGIFGCDYIVTPDNRVLFIEINARKQGTTLQFCHALQQLLPPGSPSLPELEYAAVMEGRFPDKTMECGPVDDCRLWWGTYNYKLQQDCRTCGFIPQAVHQADSFAKIAQGSLRKDFLVVEHVGSEMDVRQGTFLSRVVSIGRNRRDMLEGLENGRKQIELTIAP
jgi:hypothetical protein